MVAANARIRIPVAARLTLTGAASHGPRYSEVSANVSSRLSGALQAFDTDTVLAVAGAAAPLLDHRSAHPPAATPPSPLNTRHRLHRMPLEH